MSDALRAELSARLLQHADAKLRRVSCEVAGEQVLFWLRGEGLHESCTCGRDGCEHLRAALRFLSGASAPSLDARTRMSSSPPAPVGDSALATALEELCLATARAGIRNADSPSIQRALRELLAASEPTPLPLARWVGRLGEALATKEVGETARLFAGALAWVDQLRANDSSEAARAQRAAWLDEREGLAGESLADVTLLEVAREWVAGTTRAQIERRYLVELSAGDVFVEERRRGELDVSVGPCPRLASVAFAELTSATRPPRARLLQYTITVQVPETALARVVVVAESEVAALRDRYVVDVRAAPALAEPFVIFAPAAFERGLRGALYDGQGERIELAEPLGGEALNTALRDGELVVVLGRLLGRDGGLALLPLSAIVRRGAWLELSRIT